MVVASADLNFVALAPVLPELEHDAALIAKVRQATITECQEWLRRTACSLERMATMPEVRQALLTAANNYRSAANVLEVMRT